MTIQKRRRISSKQLCGMIKPHKTPKALTIKQHINREIKRKAKVRVVKQTKALKMMVQRFRGTAIAQAFKEQEFNESFEKLLETVRLKGPRKFVNSSRRDYYKALVEPYRIWLYINSDLTDVELEAALTALRDNQATSEVSGAAPAKLSKRTDPCAVVFRAFVEYPEGRAGQQTVSRDAAAMRHIQSRNVIPEDLVELAMKPGEGLEAWKNKHVEATRAVKGETLQKLKALKNIAASAPILKMMTMPTTPKHEVGIAEEEEDGGYTPKPNNLLIRAAKGVLLDRNITIPVGTSILIATRTPRKKTYIRAVARVKAERLKSKGAKSLLAHLSSSLLGYDFK